MLSINELVALAHASEENLLAFVRRNDRIFLNPMAVGDLTSPLPEQLRHYLKSIIDDNEALSDIEIALRTGVIAGAADGDCSSDEEDWSGELGIEWRDNPCDAWAAALKSAGREAANGVITPDGRCVGPVPVQEWLTAHLPPTHELLAREVGAPEPGVASTEAEAQAATRDAQQLAATLSATLQREVQGVRRITLLRRALPRLLLVLHYWGGMPEAWLAAEQRAEAMRVAISAASICGAAAADAAAAAATGSSEPHAMDAWKEERGDEGEAAADCEARNRDFAEALAEAAKGIEAAACAAAAPAVAPAADDEEERAAEREATRAIEQNATREAAASALLTDIQSLVFIASLLVEQDASFASHEAKLHSEMGIGDEERSDMPPSYALLKLAVAACMPAGEEEEEPSRMEW